MLNAGSILLVRGVSGCGKSTLLHLLGGVLSIGVECGSATLDGMNIGTLEAPARDRLRPAVVGWMPQRQFMINSLSVFENVLLPVALISHVDAEVNRRAASLLHFRFHYFDQASRVQLLKEIETQIINNYAGYNLKKSFAPQRGALTAIEEKISDPSPSISDLDYNSAAYFKALPAHASANLQFFDRIRKDLALYRDSHIVFQSTTPLPYLSMGIDFVRVGQEVYSASDNPELEIKKGDRLLQIDAKSVDFWIEDLQNYISANTPAARTELAVDALSLRNFRYPATAQARLKFERGEDKKEFVVQAPWFLATPNYREDFKVYLAAKKIDADESQATQIIIQNQRFWNPNNADYREAFSFSELQNFSNYDSMAENTEPVLRTGIWKSGEGADEKSHGVLQIFSFGSEHVRAGALTRAWVRGN